MGDFRSRWDNWEPAKTPSRQDATSAKSPSGTSVSASGSHICEKPAPETGETPAQRSAISAKSLPATPLAIAAQRSRLAPTNLDRGDWSDFFAERASILEADGGIPYQRAERLAFESCVTAMGWILPVDFPANECAACGAAIGRQDGLTITDGSTVCGPECHQQHRAQQRERSVLQLGELGITVDR